MTVLNNAAMSIEVHLFFRVGTFVFSGYLPRNRITGSYDNSIFSLFKIQFVHLEVPGSRTAEA